MVGSQLHLTLEVLLFAIITALATGLGAVPFAFGRMTRRALGVSNALAAGLMIAASWIVCCIYPHKMSATNPFPGYFQQGRNSCFGDKDGKL